MLTFAEQRYIISTTSDYGVIFVNNMLMQAISSVDEVYTAAEHAPAWIYILIGALAVGGVVFAAVRISKKHE